MEVKVVGKSIYEDESQKLLQELNQALIEITGQDGSSGFYPEDVSKPGSCFMVAYIDEIPFGCGALRQISNDTAELKRIYARKNKAGVGRSIIKALEDKAREFGYTQLVLSARSDNPHALEFYENLGYTRRERFGKYVDNPYSCCYEKLI